MRKAFLPVILVILIATRAPLFGDAGILIPRDKQQPNACHPLARRNGDHRPHR
jgi:hypothetical protein